MANLGGLFAHRNDHPLASPGGVRQVVADLPQDNAFKALDEIAGWLESMLATDALSPEQSFEAVRALDEAAQPHLRRLSREYLHTLRLSRSEEKRLWTITHGLWSLLAQSYERPLEAAGPAVGGLATPQRCTRLLVALRTLVKWEQFHYGPTPVEVWRRLGNALLHAERAGVATRPLVSLGAGQGSTSPQLEYYKAMIFHAASMDSLLPLEIELAERLIAHFLPQFVLTDNALHDSVYWVDLADAQPPQRLARMPAEARPTQRFFKPGPGHTLLQGLLEDLQRGGDVPPEINLGGQYAPRVLIPVLRHLASYLAAIPPQRRHDRHRVKHRMTVLNGLINAFVVFSGEFGGRPAGLQMESWVVENVSRGGFGAVLESIPVEWLKVGALLALQPEGGENWLLGSVRRYRRDSDHEARVGIETLARQVISVELRLRRASSYAATGGIPALLLLDGNRPGELRVVLPPNTFDLRESYEYSESGRRYLLEPLSVLEQTADYELACYRQRQTG